MIRDTFWNDQRLSPTAKGVGAFIAEHADAVPLPLVLNFFRDPQLTIAHALDELEALGYVTRHVPNTTTEPNIWQVYYTANRATLGGVNAA